MRRHRSRRQNRHGSHVRAIREHRLVAVVCESFRREGRSIGYARKIEHGIIAVIGNRRGGKHGGGFQLRPVVEHVHVAFRPHRRHVAVVSAQCLDITFAIHILRRGEAKR